MTDESVMAQAWEWAKIDRQAFEEAADYLRMVPENEWDGPTGAAQWNIRVLADHMAGEAVWFPNLVRGVTQGEKPLPMEVYEDLKRLPPGDLLDRLRAAAADIQDAVDAATPADLEKPADMGWMSVPLWRAVFVNAGEGVFHGWDARAGREPDATIPEPWAEGLARGMGWLGPKVAHRKWAAQLPGRYLLRVDEVGPVMVEVRDGRVTMTPGEEANPDVALALTADQYVRLIAGRFPLPPAVQSGKVRVEGEPDRALALNRIFFGIANSDD